MPVFVVARLMAEMNTAAMFSGLPRRYADYGDSIFGVGLGHKDFGWTAYGPLTNYPPSPVNDPFFVANVISTAAVVALAITVIAAVVEAVLGRRWPAGVATILTPVAGAGIILTALYYRSPFTSGIQLNLLLVLVLVLLGVAVREVWSRVWAPRASQSDSGY